MDQERSIRLLKNVQEDIAKDWPMSCKEVEIHFF